MSESNQSLRIVFGNLSGFHGRIGLVITWKRLNLKRSQVLQVQTRYCTSESYRPLRVVFGNWSGFNGRMGLVIAWKAILTHIRALNPFGFPNTTRSDRFNRNFQFKMCLETTLHTFEAIMSPIRALNPPEFQKEREAIVLTHL
ncbi:uncharacterized protein G2W53_004427 [Senna tora]|uniref:Uncharacterized protein n=1 Tax=Senna tora TaxID=362788 RepID=A0A835CH93_9FABA|nr:uncharacterized protein G2W53_004427 [Senna tora]